MKVVGVKEVTDNVYYTCYGNRKCSGSGSAASLLSGDTEAASI